MGQVAITLNDRTYRLVCDDGEEDRLVELAGFVKSKVEHLRAEIGHVGDERLMLMEALMIADELFDARAAQSLPNGLQSSLQSGGKAQASGTPPASRGASAASAVAVAPDAVSKEPEPVQKLRALAAKMTAERDGALEEPRKPEAGGTLAAAKARRRDVA